MNPDAFLAWRVAGVCKIATLAVLVLPFAASALALGKDVSPAEEPDTQGPYCGIYAVYGALNALGRPVEFESLLSPRYVSSAHGSKAADLLKAIQDRNMCGTTYSGLGLSSLRSTEVPIILHVASNDQLDAYNHWVLFLGMDGDIAQIADSSAGLTRVPIAQLLANWDGNGIYVSDRPIIAQEVLSSSLLMLSVCGVATLAGVAFFRWVFSSLESASARMSVALAQAVAIATIGSILGAGVAFFPSGFANNKSVLNFIAVATNDHLLKECTIEDVRNSILAPMTTIIDARYSQDFAAVHIQGALNIPIDAGPRYIDKAIEDIPITNRIILYCQSASCPFSKILARRLIQRGFTDIVIYPGGWSEWENSSK